MRKEDVSFIRKGDGKDLVFLHGYLSSKEAFLPFLDYFSGRYRVTAFDFWFSLPISRNPVRLFLSLV